MRIIRYSISLFTVLLTLSLVVSGVNIAFAVPTVTLKVLNVPNEFGDIVVVRGNNVEVEFIVTDPMNESSHEDIIRLVRVEDSAVATQMARGKELSGSRSLGTQKTTGNDILGKLQAQYISRATKQVLASSVQSVFLVDNQSMVELTDRTGAVEKEVIVAKEKAEAADAKATEAKTKAEALQARADLLEQQASELRARADAADNKMEAAKLDMLALKMEQEAARLERQANALAAQEAKAAAAAADTKAADARTRADAADTKATEARTKADAADTKATDARTRADAADTKAAAADAKAATADAKATDAQVKADTALADTADLQDQINNLPSSAQSCPAGEYVTGIDADGNIVCISLPAASMPAIRLLAYYPFNGNVEDVSGNNYSGTVGGTAAYGAGHNGTGQSFSLNGATYISTSLDIDVDVQPQLTMGAWVRPNAGTIYAQILTHDDQGFDRSLVHYGNSWCAYDGVAGGSYWTGTIVATDNWQFVAVVYDQDRQTVMLYVDGSTLVKANQLLGPSVNMFRMGNNQSNGQEFFLGLVDEVFVVSGALDVVELDQIRLNGVRSLFP